MKTDSIRPQAATRSNRAVQGRGFTLIELMTTVAIAAILLGIGVPSFTTFIKSQGVRTASFNINSMLIFARSEAIKRNNNVVITPASGGWNNGWTVTTTSNATTTTLSSQAAFPGLAITGPSTSLTYGSDGRLVGTTAPSFEISGSTSTRCVNVGLSGLPMSKTGSC